MFSEIQNKKQSFPKDLSHFNKAFKEGVTLNIRGCSKTSLGKEGN